MWCRVGDSWSHNIMKMSPVAQVKRIRRSEVLSSMIVWNAMVYLLLVLAVCGQGQADAAAFKHSHSSQSSPQGTNPEELHNHMAKRSSQHAEPHKHSVKRSTEDEIPEEPVPNHVPVKLAKELSQSQSPKADPDPNKAETPNTQPKNSETGKEKPESQPPQPQPTVAKSVANTTTTNTTKGETGHGLLPAHIPSMSTEAVLRGFYVFVGIGVILLIYIVIKLVRLRRRRAPGKYRILSHTDDQEMFPLAAADGEDEEIFNAAHHMPAK